MMATKTKTRKMAFTQITLDVDTIARLRSLADGKPMAAYLRELSLEWPKQPKKVDIEGRLRRIEKILGARVDIDDVPLEKLVLDEIGRAKMRAMIEHFEVDTLSEVCDALKWYRENGNSHDRLEAMRIYHELADIFSFPTLTAVQTDKFLRFIFNLVEKINHLEGG